MGRPKGHTKTHCIHGHAYDAENTAYTPAGALRCRKCASIRNKAAYHGDKASHRAKRVYRDYGLTQEAFYALLTRQNGACAICHKPIITNDDMHIDHDHKTGKVRGLLCIRCNLGLGHFKDSIDALRSAAQYITQHS